MNKKREEDGYLLAEVLMIATVVLLILSTSQLRVPVTMQAKNELLQITVQVIEELRRMQQSTLYGYEAETLSLTTLVVQEDGILWRNNNRLIKEKQTFPRGIHSSTGIVLITFQPDGRPQKDTIISLRHDNANIRTLIYIAAQTGRIRYEIYEDE